MSQKKPKKVLIVGHGSGAGTSIKHIIEQQSYAKGVTIVETVHGIMNSGKTQSYQNIPRPYQEEGLGYLPKGRFLNKPKNKARFNKKKKF